MKCEISVLKSNCPPRRITGSGISAAVCAVVSTMYVIFGSFNLAIAPSVARWNIFSASGRYKISHNQCITLRNSWQDIPSNAIMNIKISKNAQNSTKQRHYKTSKEIVEKQNSI